MTACLDVHYKDNAACAAAVVFKSWEDNTPVKDYAVILDMIQSYKPGRFY